MTYKLFFILLFAISLFIGCSEKTNPTIEPEFPNEESPQPDTIDKYYLEALQKDKIYINDLQQSKQIVIRTNHKTWKANIPKKDHEWCQISQKDSILTIQILDNFGGTSRETTIDITAHTDFQNELNTVITIEQSGITQTNNLFTSIWNNPVIFIRFKDQNEFTKGWKEYYDPMFNAPDQASLLHYYQEVSYGKMTIRSFKFPLSKPDNEQMISYQAKYTLEEVRRLNKMQLQNFLVEVYNEIKPQLESFFSAQALDMDNDNFVDNIYFIAQGVCNEWGAPLWEHRSVFVGINDDLRRFHNKLINSYVFSTSENTNLRVVCHEMFHVFGAPDLYYGGASRDYVTNWDIMAMTKNPIQMCAHSKFRYAKSNWIASEEEITTSGVYRLRPLNSSSPERTCYKITSSDPKQYFVLEFRKAKGLYEKHLPGSGLLVYRITEGLHGNNFRGIETYVLRPGTRYNTYGNIDEAYFSLESGRTRLNTTSDPALTLADGTVEDRFEISEISSAAQSELSFRVTFKQ